MAVAAKAIVLGPDVDASGAVVDDNPDRGQFVAVAARALDRIDRHLVARTAGHRDLAGDVFDRHAAVAADLDLAREALRLLRAAVATLIRTRQRRVVPGRLDDVPDDGPDLRVRRRLGRGGGRREGREEERQSESHDPFNLLT